MKPKPMTRVGAAAGPLPVTVVVPVKNEANNLPACLDSLEGVAAILVVDSSSTDATVSVARERGAEVVNFAWTGTFPKKRNWVLQTYAFATPWVLFLDADEQLTAAFKQELRGALAAAADTVGFWLRYDNHFQGALLRHGVPQRKLALFRVGAGFYERIEEDRWSQLDMEVHEHPILEGPVGEIRTPLVHDSRHTVDDILRRHRDYAAWEAERFIALMRNLDGQKTLTLRQRVKYGLLAQPWFATAYFLYAYLVRLGVLDGGAGLEYARLKWSYFSMVRANIRRARGAPPAASGA